MEASTSDVVKGGQRFGAAEWWPGAGVHIMPSSTAAQAAWCSNPARLMELLRKQGLGARRGEGFRFDLGGPQTYDTRPMPEDGSKLSDLTVLADAAATVELQVPLAGLARLVPLLASPQGTARSRVAFGRDRGHLVADVEVESELTLRCQRCLGEFMLPVHSSSRVALVPDESRLDAVPEDLETALAEEGRMRLRDLVEEELLLAVPGAPRHVDGPCAGRADAAAAETQSPATQRPFAALAGLMSGGGTKN